MTSNPSASALIDLVVASAAPVLTEAWGSRVRLAPAETERAVRYRSTVLRCHVAGGPTGAPATVIVKSSRGDPVGDYDLADLGPQSGAGRLLNEWAGTDFLHRATADAPMCAQVFGGDRAQGVVVLEDLGDGPCLADLLLGSAPGPARAGLLAYAAGLGRLHAATIGREAEYRQARVRLGLSPTVDRSPAMSWFQESSLRLREGCAGLGVAWPDAADRELAAVASVIDEPGPFLAFTPGDTCPDNHRLAGDRVRFFDFEFCGFWHALSDAAYLWLPLPTCWCVNRFPPPLIGEAGALYRAELARGCPVANDAEFDRSLLLARAVWTFATVGDRLAPVLEEDERWGIATLRQRHLLRLETFVAGADEIGHLPALAALARGLLARLRERWGGAAEMPLYPAFRGVP